MSNYNHIRAEEIADRLVPAFRGQKLSSSSPEAKLWQAAYDGADLAFGSPSPVKTLRDEAAFAAMTGLLARTGSYSAKTLAGTAYEIADEMMGERG